MDVRECRLHRVEGGDSHWSDEQRRIGALLDVHLAGRAAWLGRVFATTPRDRPAGCDDVAGAIVRILLRREFNYQANGRVAHLLPAVREQVARCVRDGRPLPIYFLYHGGYRASPRFDSLAPIFVPDATELMLLVQAARLQEQVVAVHPPGISFTLVINNGVASWTNDIPRAATEGYARHLQWLIARLGAQRAVSVLVQSALGDFDAEMRGVAIAPVATIGIDDHRTVERFLGRACTEEEARERLARYPVAEAAWAKRLAPLIAATSGIFMRQIAHPACLSFRPFSGGAARAQNGAVGFRVSDGSVPVPFLITSRTDATRSLLDVPVTLPWLGAYAARAA